MSGAAHRRGLSSAAPHGDRRLTPSEFHPHPLVRLLHTTWPLFRAFRVNVRVSWTVAIWPVVFALPLTRWLPIGEALAWGAAWTVGLFTTVWTHEMGHIAAGRRRGIESETITLRGLGGLAHMDAPAQTPRDEVFIALAGPATHLPWLALLLPAAWWLEAAHGHETWFAMLHAFGRLQVSMLVFNLLPVYPLDGGRVLRGFLAGRMHANRATLVTAHVGFAGNGVLVVLGLLAWTGIADPLGHGPYGALLVWIGAEGIGACRRLRLEARHGEIYGAQDPFQRTLLASQAAVREMEAEERRERDAAQAARERRRRLQETADRLLDRINEVGGVEGLSAKERRELEKASRALREGSEN